MNTTKTQLIEKLRNKDATIGIISLGGSGLQRQKPAQEGLKVCRACQVWPQAWLLRTAPVARANSRTEDWSNMAYPGLMRVEVG
jgi:hypothetical protein